MLPFTLLFTTSPLALKSRSVEEHSSERNLLATCLNQTQYMESFKASSPCQSSANKNVDRGLTHFFILEVTLNNDGFTFNLLV